ncbi:MAG: hypothetical protein ABSD57_01470 [Verrucomicrobiota bacterium]|jgi:hypothetical protein
MSEFKFACPVCGQHIKCESWRSNTVMECPTCFQAITVPQAPTADDPKFIIAGTKVGGERPVPLAADAGAEAAPEKQFPIAVFVVVLLLCAAVAAVFVFRGKIFKSTGGPTSQVAAASDGKQTPAPASLPPGVVVPPPDSTNWTLNLGTMTIPDSPVVGYIHGKVLIPQRMILNADGLTLRTPDNPPEAGVTIYLRENLGTNLFGKSVVIKTNAAKAPLVNLRWKNAQGQPVTQSEQGGYALRIEFGQPVGKQLPGKIYLCTPDEMKSYVVGAFNADIMGLK